jgi:predicted ABC-type ATPase
MWYDGAMVKRTCYIIAGPNGSGKTTFATDFLPKYAVCENFVNPDFFARAYSPFDPDSALFKAAKATLAAIDENILKRRDFAFETTLSGRSYAAIIQRIRDAGFVVTMFYLWIPSPALSIQRIKARVKQGGHDVPQRDVLRRFSRTQTNLFTLYRPLLDNLFFFDNSAAKPRLVFTEIDGSVSIYDQPLYTNLTKEFASCQNPEKK